MKILFVDFSLNIYDKHAVYSIAAVLKSFQWNVKYICHKSDEVSAQFIKAYSPDLILYSCLSNELHLAVDFDKKMKEQFKFHSVIGGPGPTYDRKDIDNSTIDGICMGEGETALVDYINSGFLPNSNIVHKNGVTDKKKYFPLVELSVLPFPDRSVIYDVDAFLRNMPSKQFMAGRGCPYRCTYCHNHIMMEEFKDAGPKFRYKTVDYLIAEIQDVMKKYPLQNIVFQDDVFILDKKWLREFCDKYPKAVGLPFTCNVRANLLNDDIVKLLKDSGCVGASWSIESGNDFLRNKILLRNMSRKVIMNAAELLNKYNLRHRTGNIVGIPGETFEQMLETLELNIEIKPYLAMAYTFVPFPGLSLTEYAINNGHLKAADVAFIPRTFFTPSILNFDEAMKKKISALSLLFPTLVKIPFFYYNRPIFEFLMELPVPVLRFVYHFTNILYTSRMFQVKMSSQQKFRGFMRYIHSGM